MKRLGFYITFMLTINVSFAQQLPINFVHLDTTEEFHTTFLNSVDGRITRTDYASVLESLYEPEKETIRLFSPEGRVDTIPEFIVPNPSDFRFRFDEPAIYFNDSANAVRFDLKNYTQEVILDELPENSWFWGRMNDDFVCLEANGGEVDRSNEVQHDGGTLYYEDMMMKGFLLDLQGNTKRLFDIEQDGWPISEYHDVGRLIYPNDGDKIVVEASIYESGGRSDGMFFLVDINNGSVSKLDKLNEFTEGGNKYLTQEFFDVTGNYLFVPAKNYGFSVDNPYSKVLLFDNNFNYLQECLPRKMQIVGYNYESDTAVSINLRSTLDIKKSRWDDHLVEAIIAYSLTVDIEKVLYAIYRNQELSSYDIESLDQEQLQLAKNMVFARHNYQFSSSYYQAFFNLFDFYNTEAVRKTRTKTMEGKLSYHDNRNLELFERYIRN